MEKTKFELIQRVVDANLNRLKEGLRVIEDIYRFIYNNYVLTKELKDIRHKITTIIGEDFIKNAIIKGRQVEGDLGKKLDNFKKQDLEGIIFANFQRVKESIRVLEEMFKLLELSKSIKIKELRYRIYELEKSITKKMFTLSHTRSGSNKE